METLENEIKVVKRIHSYPQRGLKSTTEKLVEVDGEFVIELTGKYCYELETIVKAYTKDGEYLGEMKQKSEYEEKFESKIVSNLYSTNQICYINNEFYPIHTKGMRLDEIYSSVQLIKDSFDVEEKYLDYLETDWIRRTLGGYFTDYQWKRYRDENRVPMFCVSGPHTRSIMQYVDAKTFDLEKYKENIKIGKKKYPDWSDYIDRMVLWNKDSIKLIQKLKRRLK